MLLQLHQSAKTIRALPLSVIIEEAYKKNRNRPPSLQLLASKCCLSEEQVQMWWDHLQQNALNRARGVEKAKATRQRKKQEKKMTLCLYKRANFADVLKCLRYQEIQEMINRRIFKYIEFIMFTILLEHLRAF